MVPKLDKETASYKLHKTNALKFAWNYNVKNIYQTNISSNQKLNWPPINQRFKQCVTSTVFKFVQRKCPAYVNEVFRPAENIRINTRNSYLKPSFSKNHYRKKQLFLYWACYLEQNSRNFEENFVLCYPRQTIFLLTNIAININIFCLLLIML